MHNDCRTRYMMTTEHNQWHCRTHAWLQNTMHNACRTQCMMTAGNAWLQNTIHDDRRTHSWLQNSMRNACRTQCMMTAEHNAWLQTKTCSSVIRNPDKTMPTERSQFLTIINRGPVDISYSNKYRKINMCMYVYRGWRTVGVRHVSIDFVPPGIHTEAHKRPDARDETHRLWTRTVIHLTLRRLMSYTWSTHSWCF